MAGTWPHLASVTFRWTDGTLAEVATACNAPLWRRHRPTCYLQVTGSSLSCQAVRQRG